MMMFRLTIKFVASNNPDFNSHAIIQDISTTVITDTMNRFDSFDDCCLFDRNLCNFLFKIIFKLAYLSSSSLFNLC